MSNGDDWRRVSKPSPSLVSVDQEVQLIKTIRAMACPFVSSTAGSVEDKLLSSSRTVE